MKLSEWMKDRDPDKVAVKLGAPISSFNNWLYGYRVPRPEMMRKIHKMTQGAVTPNDFYDQVPTQKRQRSGA